MAYDALVKVARKGNNPTIKSQHGSRSFTFKSIDIELKNLLLDPNNYRFLDNPTYKRKIKTKFHIKTVQDATLRLLEKGKRYQLPELKKSILTNGYVPMERIIVARRD
jgi:hypothetical protein